MPASVFLLQVWGPAAASTSSSQASSYLETTASSSSSPSPSPVYAAPYKPSVPFSGYEYCRVNPSDRIPFELLDTNSGLPLINNNGLAELPTVVMEDSEIQLLSFKEVTGAPSGLFDMVFGQDKYLAIFESRKVGFVSASTNGQTYAGTGPDRYITTVFSLTCEGRITAGIVDGETFELEVVNNQWRVRVLTPFTKRAFYPPSGIFVSLQPPAVPPEMWRCPSNQKAMFKVPRVEPSTNGCGTVTGIGSFVPDLDFTKCCDGHDTCFGTSPPRFHLCSPLPFLYQPILTTHQEHATSLSHPATKNFSPAIWMNAKRVTLTRASALSSSGRAIRWPSSTGTP